MEWNCPVYKTIWLSICIFSFPKPKRWPFGSFLLIYKMLQQWWNVRLFFPFQMIWCAILQAHWRREYSSLHHLKCNFLACHKVPSLMYQWYTLFNVKETSLAQPYHNIIVQKEKILKDFQYLCHATWWLGCCLSLFVVVRWSCVDSENAGKGLESDCGHSERDWGIVCE